MYFRYELASTSVHNEDQPIEIGARSTLAKERVDEYGREVRRDAEVPQSIRASQ